ncbi:antibiotic biosynthesis monooxygenase family protein [Bordetella trematum]|uniref:antibiotic biosynthesis monooxygenase family protein n=1 Tax=Bordetella trematum TaxID=123899 RepID=UPI003989AA70
MIYEHTQIWVQAGQQKAFETAARKGLENVIAKAKGYIAHELIQDVQDSSHYLLRIQWQTLENHLVDFRQSPAFPEWRAFISGFFQQPPQTEHFRTTAAA